MSALTHPRYVHWPIPADRRLSQMLLLLKKLRDFPQRAAALALDGCFFLIDKRRELGAGHAGDHNILWPVGLAHGGAPL